MPRNVLKIWTGGTTCHVISVFLGFIAVTYISHWLGLDLEPTQIVAKFFFDGPPVDDGLNVEIVDSTRRPVDLGPLIPITLRNHRGREAMAQNGVFLNCDRRYIEVRWKCRSNRESDEQIRCKNQER